MIGCLLIDAEDRHLLARHAWCVDANGYVLATGAKRITLRLHRLIMGVEHRSQHVDHINGNPLDNRRRNLRIVTPAENTRNRRPVAGKHSKGTELLSSGRWRARIWLGGRLVSLGTYTTQLEAAAAYDRAAVKHWGEYAYTNSGERA